MTTPRFTYPCVDGHVEAAAHSEMSLRASGKGLGGWH